MADEAPPAGRLPELGAWGLAVAVLVALYALPDVLTRLRQSDEPYAEAPADCDPRLAECEASFPDGVTVHLAIRPGARASDPLGYEVHVHGGGVAEAIVVQGKAMNMGLWTSPLAASAPGVWTAQGTLPYCTLEEMVWRVTVQLQGRSADFTLVTRP